MQCVSAEAQAVAIITWESKYSVGVDAMDAQHQKWFGILNRLHDAMLSGKAKDVQQNILGEMVAYTRNHFEQEEAMLKSKGYPVLGAHQTLHGAFTKQVQELAAKVASGTTVLSADVMDFLQRWAQAAQLDRRHEIGARLKTH